MPENRYGEPWRAGSGVRTNTSVVRDEPIPGTERTGHSDTAHYGGHLIAESIPSAGLRERIITCVNFCAGEALPLPVDDCASLGAVLELVHDLYQIGLRGEHAFGMEQSVRRMETAGKLLRACGRLQPPPRYEIPAAAAGILRTLAHREGREL